MEISAGTKQDFLALAEEGMDEASGLWNALSLSSSDELVEQE